MPSFVMAPLPPTQTQSLLARLRGQGWTIEDVATALEVNWWTVYRWEKGYHQPRPAYFSALKRLVGRSAPA